MRNHELRITHHGRQVPLALPRGESEGDESSVIPDSQFVIRSSYFSQSLSVNSAIAVP
jgi:hypothetical protein